jgi:hypothetical protein
MIVLLLLWCKTCAGRTMHAVYYPPWIWPFYHYHIPLCQVADMQRTDAHMKARQMDTIRCQPPLVLPTDDDDRFCCHAPPSPKIGKNYPLGLQVIRTRCDWNYPLIRCWSVTYKQWSNLLVGLITETLVVYEKRQQHQLKFVRWG